MAGRASRNPATLTLSGVNDFLTPLTRGLINASINARSLLGVMSPFFIVGVMVWIFFIGTALYARLCENRRKPLPNFRTAKRNFWPDA
jgi:hypothetical protein